MKIKLAFWLLSLLVLAACGTSTEKKSEPTGNTFAKSLDANDVSKGSDSVEEKEVELAEQKPQKVEDLHEELAEHIDKARYEEAKVLCARLLSTNASDPLALNSLGIIAYRESKPGIASIFWSRVLAKDSKNSSALNNMGVLAKLEKRDSDAISLFKRAIQSDSDNVSAMANLGTLYLEYQNYKAAKASFSIANSSYRKNANFQNNYALSLNGVGESKAAIRLMKSVYQDNSKDLDIAMNYVSLLVHNKEDLKDAADILSRLKILTQDPKDLVRISKLQKSLQVAQAEIDASKATTRSK